MPDKNFFHEFNEHIFSVDKFLFNNICTYHNIVKNSVLKLINAQETPLIKSEVCYFKNLNINRIKQRRSMRLELAIRQKMQMFKRDCKEFLKSGYPELFNAIKEEDDKDRESFVENDHRRNNTSSVVQERVMEESSFILQIEELLENSKEIKTEEFKIPRFIFNKKKEIVREIAGKFYDQMLRVYEDFADFKIIDYSNEKLNEKL